MPAGEGYRELLGQSSPDVPPGHPRCLFLRQRTAQPGGVCGIPSPQLVCKGPVYCPRLALLWLHILTRVGPVPDFLLLVLLVVLF